MTDVILNSGSVPVYADFASFPSFAADGSLAVDLASDTLYEFDGNSSTWVLIGPGGGGGGGVTAVTASSPVTSSGGTAPNIALPQSSASQDGYLSAVDWSAFDNKSSVNYFVDSFPLDGTDISNKFVMLTHSPSSPELSILTVIGGIVQEYSIDYVISGSTLSWSGLFLDGVLSDGDVLLIQYTY